MLSGLHLKTNPFLRVYRQFATTYKLPFIRSELIPLCKTLLIRKKTNTNFFEIVYFYTSILYCIINLKNQMIWFDKKSLMWNFKFLRQHSLIRPLFKAYCYLIKSIFFLFSHKIKFKGKGYYMFKNNRNAFALQFGYSHRVRLYFHNIRAKFLNKTTILFFGNNRNCLTRTAFELRIFRTINIFTLKGIRFSKQIIYKKTGKVGSYR